MRLFLQMLRIESSYCLSIRAYRRLALSPITCAIETVRQIREL